MLFLQIPHTNQTDYICNQIEYQSYTKLDKHEIVLCINLDLTILNKLTKTKKQKREIINQ